MASSFEGKHCTTCVDDSGMRALNSEENPWNALAHSRLSLLATSSKNHNSHAADQDRQRLDADIMAIQHALSAFCQRRNLLAPISRIPVELLVNIFSFLAVMDPPALRRGVGQPGWIKVTEVCHRWRCAALENGRLWTHILTSTLNLRWIHEMAARSKSVPLSFQYNSRSDQPDSKSDIIFTHIARTRALSITSPHSISVDLQRALTSSAPMLESLEILLETTTHVVSGLPSVTITFTPGGTPYSIPNHLFAHDAPKLRRLRLHDCVMSWTPAVFSGLTHLEMTRPRDKRKVPLGYNALQMLQGLSQMGSLENLLISYTFPPPEGDGLSPEKLPSDIRVDFPRMTRLTLEGEMLTCLVFKGRLKLPEDVSIRLQLDEEKILQDFSSIQMGPSLPVTILRLKQCGLSLQIMGWTSSERPKALFSATLNPSHGSSAMNQLLNILNCLPPLSSLKRVHLDGQGMFLNVAQWHKLFSSSHLVSKVFVEGRLAGSCIEALFPALSRDAPIDEASRCMFPALECLYLRDIPFNQTANSNFGEKSLYALLPLCMEQRAVAGCRLQMLDIDGRLFRDYSSIPTQVVLKALRCMAKTDGA